MAAATKLIRISVATAARLDAEIARLVRAYEAGRTDTVEPGACNNPAYRGLSYDDVIRRLLDRDAREQRRRDRAAARRRKSRQ